MIRRHRTRRVLNSWKSENVLKCLLGLLPVFLFDFNFGLHQHKDGVVPDREVLGERLLEEVVGGAHVASIRVDDSSEDVCLNHARVFVQAIVYLAQGSR